MRARWLGIASALAFVVLAAAAGAFLAGRRTGPVEGIGARSAPTFRLLTFRRGWIHTARFAPDGQTIVYSAAWDGKPLELFATRRDSSEARSLGLPSSASIAAISANGEMAIILECHTKPACEDGLLARAPLAGGPPRELLEHVTYADWNHDGQGLAVIHAVDGASRLEYPIGHVLYEASAGATLTGVRFSHAGTQIAFHERSGDTSHTVWVIDLQGQRRQILERFQGLFGGPEWSPRDDELWFTRSTVDNPSALYAVKLSGEQRLIERIPQAMLMKDIGTDGSALIATAAEPRWFRVVARAPGDSEERDLSVLSNPVLGDLSSDGRTVLFDDVA